MAISLAVALRTLFCALGCVMLATLVYTICVDGLPFRKSLLTPWMTATLVDFYINIVALGVWVSYKESSWISAILWVALLVCFGSITTCGYIVLQFLKLSSQESSNDPMFYVLLGRRSKDGVDGKKFSVVTARVLFSALGVLMLGTLIYTLLTDGSPFRRELLTPWMTATLIDFYINVVALSVWVAYKESSWVSALVWIALLICFGSITTCAYIVLQLFQLSSQDPVYLILLNSSTRNGFKMLPTVSVTP
ncbi:uncharacterized protein LOC132274274 isoform X2 [Cornus florida]|uniref:uncharacterized protein LOC132274274 isoform X2 n=1 Tax=Cornus florida TaxID=4283 RepID=UPI00289BA591|nr:uncharacterized protein LOC132274274 isoform X2 [Cornus florida]XP_059631496.1 uncharacterized protein LOC132274274 isoform X2 [Cornus florida]